MMIRDVFVNGWETLGQQLPEPLGWYYRQWARLARWVVA